MISNLCGIVETITGFFGQLYSKGYLSLDYIFYVGIALELILIIFFLIKSSYSYELRLDKSLDGLNRWLYYNQYIDENNLIEFNKRIKKSPKLLRYHWQQYMLYREKDPSYYMSNYNCIEKPLHTSSFSSNIKNLLSICYAIMGLTFLLNLQYFATLGITNIGEVLINSLLAPISIIILNTFFAILLRSWQNTNLAGLYQNFHLFNRYIDKACSTLPAYIDFEVLFTKDEIRKGIPVLNEYLEKRARQEQKELENARLNAIEHQEYDFDSIGIDGSQILDRAMKETEIYLNQRQRTLAEIQQLESEIESLKRNYENNQKEYQRKMQASKENVDRLRKQQEESTNRIESNYIRKQQSDEIKKQEQLEKDYDSTTMRYEQEMNTLTAEIETRRNELEEKRKYVEEAMKSEYNTFSTRVYNKIDTDLQEKEKEQKEAIKSERDTLIEELNEANLIIDAKQDEINKLHQAIENAGLQAGDHGDIFYSKELREEEEKVKLGKHNKNKTQKNTNVEQEKLEPVDETPVDNLNLTINESPEETSIYNSYEDKDLKDNENITTENENNSFEENVKEHIETQAENFEPVYDEYGGYYDDRGYYIYQNGTYYDDKGNYYDLTGGYYDADGTYHPAEQNEIISESTSNIEEMPSAENDNLETKEVSKEDDENSASTKEENIEIDKFSNNSNADSPNQNETQTENTTTTEESIESSEQPVKRRGRPKKITSDEPQQNKTPKKRGRPKLTSTTQVAKTTSGKRGRPRKITTTVVEEIVEEKKHRGRPKKITKTTVIEEEIDRPVKRRGRPKSTNKPEKTSTGKRGRPKSLNKPPKTSTGKRGRPKKTSDKVEIFDELEKLNKQIQEENEKLKQNHAELSAKIDDTLLKIEDNHINDDNDDNDNNLG